MTINIRVEVARDLSVENNVFSFGFMCQEKVKNLMAAAWFLEGESEINSLKVILNNIVDLVNERLDGHDLWLLSGNSAWQNDSRIVNYRGLWGAYEARGIMVSDFIERKEIFIRSENRIKFFGSAVFTMGATESVAKIIIDERNTYVAVMPRNFDMLNIIKSGWSGHIYEDIEAFSSMIDSDGIIFRKYGEFDDKERGLLAFGKPSTLKGLVD